MFALYASIYAAIALFLVLLNPHGEPLLLISKQTLDWAAHQENGKRYGRSLGTVKKTKVKATSKQSCNNNAG